MKKNGTLFKSLAIISILILLCLLFYVGKYFYNKFKKVTREGLVPNAADVMTPDQFFRSIPMEIPADDMLTQATYDAFSNMSFQEKGRTIQYRNTSLYSSYELASRWLSESEAKYCIENGQFAPKTPEQKAFLEFHVIEFHMYLYTEREDTDRLIPGINAKNVTNDELRNYLRDEYLKKGGKLNRLRTGLIDYPLADNLRMVVFILFERFGQHIPIKEYFMDTTNATDAFFNALTNQEFMVTGVQIQSQPRDKIGNHILSPEFKSYVENKQLNRGYAIDEKTSLMCATKSVKGNDMPPFYPVVVPKAVKIQESEKTKVSPDEIPGLVKGFQYLDEPCNICEMDCKYTLGPNTTSSVLSAFWGMTESAPSDINGSDQHDSNSEDVHTEYEKVEPTTATTIPTEADYQPKPEQAANPNEDGVTTFNSDLFQHMKKGKNCSLMFNISIN